MKGIELSILDDGQLQIRCLEHGKTHTGTVWFCCTDLMIRAIGLAIRQTPGGYHAYMGGQPRRGAEQLDLIDVARDILTTPLMFSATRKEGTAIEEK